VCNCGGGGGRTIGQAAQRRSGRSSMPAGFDESAPVLIGEANEQLWRVRVIVPAEGLARSQQAWVTGTGVQQHFDSGAFQDISSTTQRRRMWRVGGFTYTSWQEASRVAAAQGTTPIEVA
jgi:hypothetical protein